jgi:hypothetical protein
MQTTATLRPSKSIWMGISVAVQDIDLFGMPLALFVMTRKNSFVVRVAHRAVNAQKEMSVNRTVM